MTDMMNVVIIEDEMLLTMDLEAMVEDSGHRVLAEAASVQDVESWADDFDPQLAFVDLHLAHGSSGLDASKIIQKRWPKALIVFVTANVAKIPEDLCGAHGVIAKPFSHASIVSTIKYLADGVSNPPPRLPRPASFTPSVNLIYRWEAAQLNG